MKKILFLTVFCAVFIMHSYAWSALTTHKFDSKIIDLGTIKEDFLWSNTDDALDNYSLTFAVENDNGVDFKVNMQKNQIIWFFDGKENKWNTADKDSASWLWTKHFDKGSYTLNIYGKIINAHMVLGNSNPVPLPSALIFLVSGIVGLFSIRRFKKPVA